MFNIEYELNGITFNTINRAAGIVTGYVLQTSVGIFANVGVKYTTQVLPEKHGNISYPSYLDSRAIILEGYIIGSNEADLNIKWARLNRAVSILSEPLPLKFKPAGMPPMQVNVKLQDVPDIQNNFDLGPFVAEFKIPLIADDPFIYSQAFHEATAYYQAALGGLVVPTPVAATLKLSTSSGSLCQNRGTVNAYPKFLLYGPITNPQIIAGTGKQLTVHLDIPADNYLLIDTNERLVLLNGTANRYHVISGTFFTLEPLVTTLIKVYGITDTAAKVVVQWRDTWI